MAVLRQVEVLPDLEIVAGAGSSVITRIADVPLIIGAGDGYLQCFRRRRSPVAMPARECQQSEQRERAPAGYQFPPVGS